MPTDLVQRLRSSYEFYREFWSGDQEPDLDSAAGLCREAADEIERLRAECDVWKKLVGESERRRWPIQAVHNPFIEIKS